jgi:putative oxidoreductase
LGIGSGLSLGLATFAEFLCSIAVIVGLTTRLATIPLIVTMGVALFVYHAGDSLGDRELALLYFVGFVAVLCAGPGRFSVDEVLSKRG